MTRDRVRVRGGNGVGFGGNGESENGKCLRVQSRVPRQVKVECLGPSSERQRFAGLCIIRHLIKKSLAISFVVGRAGGDRQ